jgi:ABC-type Na+ efflux pump permease subunit
MQNVTVLLNSLVIVGERERGTMDQLLVTPIGAAGLMLGRPLPNAFVAVVDFARLLLAMHVVFAVPIALNVVLLAILSSGFPLTAFGA